MMKRLYLIYILCMCCWLGGRAQELRSLFVAMPDSVLPLLTKTNRMDCIDFLDSNMKAEVKNRFNNTSELKVLTKDYLELQLTSQSSVEMKLLPMNDSVKVVCMVHTVCGPVCDSEITFYDTQWKQLPSKNFITLPEVDRFYYLNTNEESYATVRKAADMYLMKANLSSEASTLTFIYTTPEYLSKEDREKLELYLRKEPIVYQWVEGRFQN
ncbi:MAG: DUF3256 family protein [Phocaeicola sp.]|nr:DUF3256 family protein [Phocaeicola sp.]